MTLNTLQAGLLRSAGLAFAYQLLRGVPGLGSALHGAAHRVFPDDCDVVVRIPDGMASGLRMQMDPRLDAELARGCHENWMQEILDQALEPGASFCDVGAHIGLFSLGAARVVGESGEVVALEPDPRNHRRLVRNVKRNGMCNLRALNVAAWSSPGEKRARLDALLSRPPDVVKVDVDGAEIEVLRGAGAILRSGRSTWLVKAYGAQRLRQVAAILSQSGYAPRVVREEAAPGQETYLIVARPGPRREPI
ncbi:MAG TPA: FkbM family methyltransferase [Candidatus Dormibacteraeota bacterium]